MRQLRLKAIVLIILALSFFGYAGCIYHGWSDSHVYQTEAKAWAKGLRPPLKTFSWEMNSPYVEGPTHTPAFISYSMSFFVDQNDGRRTLFYTTLFQEFLLAYCFAVFAWLVGGRKITWDGIIFSTFLFFHTYARWWAYMPFSEPLSLSLLMTSYLLPPFSGIGTALQVFTRPPVVVLHLLQLLRLWRGLFVLGSGAATAIWGVLKFRELIVPAKAHLVGWGLYKVKDLYIGFVAESAMWFRGLIPYQEKWFLILWGLVIAIAITFFIKKNYKQVYVWFFFLIYLIEILIPTGDPYRYLFPGLIYLFIELKPRLPRPKILRMAVVVIFLHLVIQQADNILNYQRDKYPETDSRGLHETQSWVKANTTENDVLLTFRYRHCANYYDRICMPMIRDQDDVINVLTENKVSYVIIDRIWWVTQEFQMEERLLSALKKAKYSTQGKLHEFINVRVYDVRDLWQKK